VTRRIWLSNGRGRACRKQDTESRQHEDNRKIAAQLIPMNVERSFKKERREKSDEDEVFRKSDLRREGQDRKNDSRRNQADAVREAESPRQHRDDGGDEEQQCSGLKI
jgi:hypothetical protein